MTRINVIHPSELSNKHLIAEYREIARIPNCLSKSLNRKIPFNMNEIPKEYKLGQGHVKFFYDKGMYLAKRFELLVAEMHSRGFKTTFTDSSIFYKSDLFYNDYIPTNEAIKINRERIKERLNKK